MFTCLLLSRHFGISEKNDIVQTSENPKNELPRYIARADGIAGEFYTVGWWKANEAELPFWFAVANLACSTDPPSNDIL